MKKHLKMPKNHDWGDYTGDPDVKYAYEVFSGKTTSEAINVFKENVINRCDNLRWMPIIPFQYYILAYRDYILSGYFDEFYKQDSVSCFMGLIKDMLVQKPSFIMPIFEELISTLRYISKNQDFFEADIDIYGDFKNELIEIENLKKKQSDLISFSK